MPSTGNLESVMLPPSTLSAITLQCALDGLPQVDHAVIDHIIDYNHPSMSPVGSLDGHTNSNYIIDYTPLKCTPPLDSLEATKLPSATYSTMIVRASIVKLHLNHHWVCLSHA
jgi:hypothetical protein